MLGDKTNTRNFVNDHTMRDMPKFVREMWGELKILRKREEEFGKSERSSKLLTKCMHDTNLKLKDCYK